MRFSETVKRVIEFAEAIDEYWSRELPKRHPNYPLVNPGEQSGPPPPEESALRQFLDSLPDEDLYRLLTLLHLGREDFPATEFDERCREAASDYPEREAVIWQLVERTLPDYLSDGLESLKASGIDIDAAGSRAA